MRSFSDDERALLARMIPDLQRVLKSDSAALDRWIATRTPCELLVLIAWIEHQASWLIPLLARLPRIPKHDDPA